MRGGVGKEIAGIDGVRAMIGLFAFEPGLS